MMSEKEDLAKVRHQIRNQLNNITMNAELVKLQVQQSMPSDKVLPSIERLLNECKRCGEYLNELREANN